MSIALRPNKKLHQQTGKARSGSCTGLCCFLTEEFVSSRRLESLEGCRWLHLASLAASLVKSRSESTHSPHPAEGEAAKVPGGQGWADQSTNKHQGVPTALGPYMTILVHVCPEVRTQTVQTTKYITENEEHSIISHLLSQS